MLDIDRNSIYHPARDRFAVGKILEALEPLGVTDCVSVTSSYRGGLHCYFPLSNAKLTWQLAAVIQRCLLRAGFYVGGGILEIFPNARTWGADSEESARYLAHRLPLQRGSYLLNDEWQMIYSDRAEFCKRWRFCAARNEINQALFNLRLKEASERRHKLSYKAKKFLNDLCSDIDGGWTGNGQTNHILGRVAMREYIFGHLHRRCEPLTGDKLTAAIADTAAKLPGFNEWCRHKPELWQRAEHWARSIESSRYYPYQVIRPKGDPGESDQAPGLEWNTWQQNRARERITFAIADMLNRGTLPAQTRERFEALISGYKFSGETLYRHRDLWHPSHLWKTPPAPPEDLQDLGRGAQGRPPAQSGLKLIDATGCNSPENQASRAFWDIDLLAIGGNTASDEGFSDSGPKNGLRGGTE